MQKVAKIKEVELKDGDKSGFEKVRSEIISSFGAL